MSEQGIGARVLRKEDMRFITGKGQYTDDINVRGQCYGVFVRSPHAHAAIDGIDTSAAEAAEGVVGVLTGAQIVEDGLGTLPCGWMVLSKDGSEMKQPAHPIMAATQVNYVGEPVALVVADSLTAARNAAELVEIDYAEKAAVVDLASAQDSAAIYEEVPRNTAYEWELGDQAATEAAFAGAAHVTELTVRNNRLIPNAIEPRAAIGDYNPSTDEMTLYTTSQIGRAHV